MPFWRVGSSPTEGTKFIKKSSGFARENISHSISIMDLPKKILGLVVVFGIINLVLWGVQEFYHREDTNKIKEIETYLENEKLSISSLETKIIQYEQELEYRESELKGLESLGFIDKYNDEVDNFNYWLSTYKSDLDSYNAKLTEYNTKVDDVNTLIEKSGSRWYLIPIPFGGGTKSKLPIR